MLSYLDHLHHFISFGNTQACKNKRLSKMEQHFEANCHDARDHLQLCARRPDL